MATIEVAFFEQAVSRTATISRISTENANEMKYHILGTYDEATVDLIARSFVPSTHPVSNYPLKSYKTYEVAPDLWAVDASYGRLPSAYRKTFGSDKERIQISRADPTIYPRNNESPLRLGRLIGVNDDRVDGVDIYVRKPTFVETHVMPMGQFTAAYEAILDDYATTINSSTFRGRAAGEVLFLGAEAQYNSEDTDVRVEFRFEVSKNRTIWVPGLRRYTGTYNPFTGLYQDEVWESDANPDNALDTDGALITKPGWSYMWFRYREDRSTVGPPNIIRKPAGVYIETVYEERDFGNLGIGIS